MKIQKNVLLKNYTTFKIGGVAKYFVAAKSKNDIVKAAKWVKENNLPFFILGGGSNLLVADEGYKGLVIQIRNSKFEIRNSKVITDAGVMLGKLVNASVAAELSGLEWATGIPGTIGGAIRGNAGAFGSEMKDFVKKVEVSDTKTQKIKTLKNKDCQFKYRESIFKKNHNFIILSIELQFKKGDKKKIGGKIKEYSNYRAQRHPKYPSAGSIFKNPENIRAKDLIEKAGLRGKKIGQAQISEQHANFIVNLGGAKAKDVLSLIALAKKKVKEKFNIILEEEIQVIHN